MVSHTFKSVHKVIGFRQQLEIGLPVLTQLKIHSDTSASKTKELTNDWTQGQDRIRTQTLVLLISYFVISNQTFSQCCNNLKISLMKTQILYYWEKKKTQKHVISRTDQFISKPCSRVICILNQGSLSQSEKRKISPGLDL